MNLVEKLEAALLDAGVSEYFITSDGSTELEAPGLTVWWDDQDPEDEGWAYRCVDINAYDFATGGWDGSRTESGEMEESDIPRLVAQAAEIYEAL